MAQKKILKPRRGNGVGAVLEEIDSKLELVLEGQQGLQQQIDTSRGEMHERFEAVDYKLEMVFESFGGVDSRFERIEASLNKKVDREEFESQVSHLEDASS